MHLKQTRVAGIFVMNSKWCVWSIIWFEREGLRKIRNSCERSSVSSALKKEDAVCI